MQIWTPRRGWVPWQTAWNVLAERIKGRDGQALVEYALIIALVAIAALAALHFLGSAAVNTVNGVSNAISTGS